MKRTSTLADSTCLRGDEKLKQNDGNDSSHESRNRNKHGSCIGFLPGTRADSFDFHFGNDF